jgi:hypothetical protein
METPTLDGVKILLPGWVGEKGRSQGLIRLCATDGVHKSRALGCGAR